MKCPRSLVLQDICVYLRVHDDMIFHNYILTSFVTHLQVFVYVFLCYFPSCFIVLPSDILIFDDFSTHADFRGSQKWSSWAWSPTPSLMWQPLAGSACFFGDQIQKTQNQDFTKKLLSWFDVELLCNWGAGFVLSPPQQKSVKHILGQIEALYKF